MWRVQASSAEDRLSAGPRGEVTQVGDVTAQAEAPLSSPEWVWGGRFLPMTPRAPGTQEAGACAHLEVGWAGGEGAWGHQ